MLAKKIIEPAQTERDAPIVFVPKKDGSLHFCVDYQKLNAVTVRNTYPVSHMDAPIDYFPDSTGFSTLPANSGYWQIEVKEAGPDNTACTFYHGPYQFTVMLFDS